MHADLGRLLELARHVLQVHAAVGLALALDIDEHEIAAVLLLQEVGQPVDAGEQPLDLAAVAGRLVDRRVELGRRHARRSSRRRPRAAATASGRPHRRRRPPARPCRGRRSPARRRRRRRATARARPRPASARPGRRATAPARRRQAVPRSSDAACACPRPANVAGRRRDKRRRPPLVVSLTVILSGWLIVRLESFNRNLAARPAPDAGAVRDQPRGRWLAVGRMRLAAAALSAIRIRARARRPHGRGGSDVRGLLKASRVIDAVNDRFGIAATWLVLFAVPDQRRQCGEPLRLQPELERLARSAVVHVRGHGVLRRALRAQGQRARARRRVLFGALGAHAHLDRHRRQRPVPAAVLRDPPLLHLAVVRGILADQRRSVERRRPDPLAGEAHAAGRLRADGAAGRVGADQARRRADRRAIGWNTATRRRCNDRVRAQQHGAPDVRGADRVHAVRLSGGVLGRGGRARSSASSASSSA